MTQIAQDPWNTSNSVPHFIPLQSAEYLTDPAVIRAYNKLCEAPDDQVRFVRRVCRNLHFGIWLRSVAWSCSLMFAIAISFMMIVRMDFRMQSLIYPQTTVVSDDESDGASATLSIKSESEAGSDEQVAESERPVIR